MTGTISYRNGRTEQIEITQREWSDWGLWALKRGIPSQVSEGTAMTWTRFLGYAAAMRALFPRVQLVRIKGAGHWVHSDQPQVFVATMRQFLHL